MDQERIEKAAAFMHQTHIDGSGHHRIPEEIRPRNLDEAYAAQVAFHRLRAGNASPLLAGYKIAATSKVIQEQVGMNEPFLGAILPGMVYRSPHSLSIEDYQQLGFECEIAVELGSDLQPSDAPFDRDRVATAVCAVRPAFELLDMRNCTLRGIDATSSITDNAMISGVVLGTPHRSMARVRHRRSRGKAACERRTPRRGNRPRMLSVTPWRGSPGLRTISPDEGWPCMPGWW